MSIDEIARPLLVVHAVIGAATIAVTTHLAVWSLAPARGKPARWRGIRWFSVVGLALYVGQFALGNLIYPSYNVQVRIPFLDVAANGLGWVVHLFEKKEHLVTFGLPLMVAAALLSRRVHGELVPRRTAVLLALCAGVAALLAWFGGIAGLIVTSYRAIGA